jgi:hypothetical protein
MSQPNGYNGWRNYETWNAALWVQNDEGWYRLACDFMRRYTGSSPWRDLMAAGDLPEKTPDGVEMLGPELAINELDRMLSELLS